jgi:hypothetical protein
MGTAIFMYRRKANTLPARTELLGAWRVADGPRKAPMCFIGATRKPASTSRIFISAVILRMREIE